MAKKKEISALVKLQCPGGQATPAPPIGPALGQHGVNIAQFVQQFNDRTKDQPGLTLPVILTVYKDRSFEFIIKSPPASILLKKAAKIAKGSGVPNQDKVGTVTMEQVQEIVVDLETLLTDPGTYQLNIVVKDRAGNEASQMITVEIISPSSSTTVISDTTKTSTPNQPSTSDGDETNFNFPIFGLLIAVFVLSHRRSILRKGM